MNMPFNFAVLLFVCFGYTFLAAHLMPKTEIKSCVFMTKCKCIRIKSGLMFTVDCSRLGLGHIPRFPDVVEELRLNKNNITDIADHSFINNSKLQTLDLSENKILRLRKSSFKGLGNLLYLNLKSNNLDLGNQSFIDSPFEYLRSLTSLNLKMNFAGPYQPDLSTLISLNSLSIDFISDSTGILAQHYAGLKQLTCLDMSGLSGNCSIKQLSSYSFQHLLHIKALNISGCKLKSILKSTFAKLKRIEVLDISNNKCLRFGVLTNVTFDLQFSQIKIFKFNKIHRTLEMNTVLKKEHIKHLQNTSLEEIYMDSNRLRVIEEGALRYLPHTLEYMSARDNKLSYVHVMGNLFSLSAKTLDFSETFTFEDSKEDNDLENCNNVNICINISLVGDSVDRNVINAFKNTTGQRRLIVPKQLRTLNFSSSKLHFKTSNLWFSDNNLENFDISHNIFTSFIGPVSNLKALRFLDMSSNMCTNLTTFFFGSDFFSLEELYLQNNFLGLVFQHDHNGETLQHLHQLKIINLSKNAISELPQDFFKSQKSLTKLDLSNNILERLDFNIDHMTNLTSLNLRNNQIRFLNSKERKQLDVIAKSNKIFKVDFGGNPFVCTCETIEFVEWMTFTKALRRKSYECRLSNLEKKDFKDPDKIYRMLQRNCMRFEPLIGALVSAVTIFIFIMCSGLVYRYRWKLRYLYYMVKIRSHNTMSSLDDNDDRKFMYDAFVSYADGDSSFVHKKLLTKLEKENGIQLCIHKRNFLPGNDIATNITSAIHNSRKTIAVISRNFLKSNWCLYEYNMARMESIYERKNENILFLIFIDQLSSREMPLHILELIHSQSYIEYPNDEHGDEVFWNQIISALKD